MTETAASTDILYIEGRDEADLDEARTNAELVDALRARTRRLAEGERVETDVVPPADAFGV